jgi:hypothetical protein
MPDRSLGKMELWKKIRAIASNYPDGSVWRHWQGGLYTVITLSVDDMTGESLITFRCNKTGKRQTLKIGYWSEEVQYGNGTTGPRFIRVIE